jgi:hypothetical protein
MRFSNSACPYVPSDNKLTHTRTYTHVQVHSKDWIRDCSSALVTQEAQPSFRARAIACLGHASPLLGASSLTSHLSGGSVDTIEPKRVNRSGSRILLLVRMNV